MQAEEAESLEPGVGGILRARRIVMETETINADDICELSLISRRNELPCLPIPSLLYYIYLDGAN
jgi:hypothetical protein